MIVVVTRIKQHLTDGINKDLLFCQENIKIYLTVFLAGQSHWNMKLWDLNSFENERIKFANKPATLNILAE